MKNLMTVESLVTVKTNQNKLDELAKKHFMGKNFHDLVQYGQHVVTTLLFPFGKPEETQELKSALESFGIRVVVGD